MTGASPFPAPPSVQRILLPAARSLRDPWGAVLELCILTGCLPWEAANADLERIDWRRGFVPVAARRGGERALGLSQAAMDAIRRITGDAGGRGQVVTAGRGRRFDASLLRMDRLLDRLAQAAPDTIALPDWNMHGLRAGAARELTLAGAGRTVVNAFLGLGTASRLPQTAPAIDAAVLGAERWCRILLEPTAAGSRGG